MTKRKLSDEVRFTNPLYQGKESIIESVKTEVTLTRFEKLAGRKVSKTEKENEFVKRSRSRRICFYVSVMFGACLLTFLGSRAFAALQITNTSPVLDSFFVTQLCSNEIQFTAVGTFDNPSVVGATVSIDKLNVLVDSELIGTINLPAVVVKGGLSDFEISGNLLICPTCINATQAALRNYFGGIQLATTFEIKLTASFSSEVFIFPVVFSTSLLIESEFDPFFDSSETKADREAAAIANAESSEGGSETETFDTLQLLSTDNTTVVALAGLNLTSSGSNNDENRSEFISEDFKLSADLPKLTFKGIVDGEEVGLGFNDDYFFGGTELLLATVLLGW